MADIAAHIDCFARGLQQFCDDGGGGSLSVASGHADGVAGANVEKDFHLRGDRAAPLGRRQEFRDIGADARRTEDHILVEPLEIRFAQLQPAAPFFQAVRQVAEGAALFFIAGRDRDPISEQQLDQRRVAHADADDGHALSFQRIQILIESHTLRSFLFT